MNEIDRIKAQLAITSTCEYIKQACDELAVCKTKAAIFSLKQAIKPLERISKIINKKAKP